MYLEYASSKMKKILSDPRLTQKYHGKHAEKIINRMSELRAADCLGDIPNVPPPRRHKLEGDLDGCWGIDYAKNFRIIVEPIGNFDISDLSTIEAIKIIELGDYH